MATKKEIVEIARKRLEEFDDLPIEERTRLLIEWGVVEPNGEVLFACEKAERRAKQAAEEQAMNGRPQ